MEGEAGVERGLEAGAEAEVGAGTAPAAGAGGLAGKAVPVAAAGPDAAAVMARLSVCPGGARLQAPAASASCRNGRWRAISAS